MATRKTCRAKLFFFAGFFCHCFSVERDRASLLLPNIERLRSVFCVFGRRVGENGAIVVCCGAKLLYPRC